MALSDLKEKFLKRKEPGLSIELGNEERTFRLFKSSVKEGNLSVDETLSVPSIAEVAEHFKGKSIVLHLSGKGILAKTGYEERVEDVFPTISVDEFFIQHFSFGSKHVWSIARKETVNAVVEELLNENIVVKSVYLGPSAVQLVNSDLVKSDEDIIANPYTINPVREEVTVGTGGTIKSYQIDQFEVESVFLNVFGAVLMNILSPQKAIPVKGSENEELLNDLIYSQRFKTLAPVMVFTFFFILLVNFGVQQHLQGERETLNAEVQLLEKDAERLEEIEKAITTQKSLLGNTGQSVRWSYYFDLLAQDIPGEIQLESLNAYPMENDEMQLSDPMKADVDNIVVEGLVADVTDFEKWYKKLDQYDWIKGKSILNYGKKSGVERSVFKIKLNVSV